MKIRPVAILLFCLLVFPKGARAFAEKPWTEVRSPHFRVLTNGSAGDARQVAHEFEQMRYVFVSQFPIFRVDSGAPLTIFAAHRNGMPSAFPTRSGGEKTMPAHAVIWRGCAR